MIHVYKNVTHKCWSVKDTKLPMQHKSGSFLLKNCHFRVQASGQKRVHMEQRKNQHAYISAKSIHYLNDYEIEGWINLINYRFDYNPYISNKFRISDGPYKGNEMFYTKIVLCTKDLKCYAIQNI